MWASRPGSALFRATWWGGVPISLFAVGAFSFFAAFALYLLLSRERAPREAYLFLGIAGCGPVVASVPKPILFDDNRVVLFAAVRIQSSHVRQLFSRSLARQFWRGIKSRISLQ